MIVNKQIIRSIAYPLLVAAYIVFFTVQLSSYIDPLGNVHFLRENNSINEQVAITQPETITKNNTPASACSQVTVRVNKRFYPSCILFHSILNVEGPVCFFREQDIQYFTKPFIARGIFHAYAERGPPAI